MDALIVPCASDWSVPTAIAAARVGPGFSHAAPALFPLDGRVPGCALSERSHINGACVTCAAVRTGSVDGDTGEARERAHLEPIEGAVVLDGEVLVALAHREEVAVLAEQVRQVDRLHCQRAIVKRAIVIQQMATTSLGRPLRCCALICTGTAPSDMNGQEAGRGYLNLQC